MKKVKSDFWRSVRYMLKFAYDNEKLLYFYFFVNILAVLIFSLTNIFIPRFLIQELISTRSNENIFRIIIVYFVLFSTSGFLISFIKGEYMPIILRLRMKVLRAIQKKGMTIEYKNIENPAFLDKKWTIEAASDNPNRGVQAIYTRLFTLSSNAVASLFYLWILSTLHFGIVAFLGVNILTVYYFKNRSNKYEVQREKEAAPVDRRHRYLFRVIDNLAFGKDIRVYGLSNWIIGKFIKNRQDRQEISKDIENKHYVSDTVEVIFALVRDALIYAVLVYYILSGKISIANFTMYFLTIATLTIALQEMFSDFSYINAQSEYIDEYINLSLMPDEGDCNKEKQIPVPQSGAYKIEFRNVSFHYPTTEEYVYKNLNLTIEPGKKLAIVGVNGAGKTTLVKLLTRLYEPTDGEILLNDININKFDIKEYRRLISVVFQDINLFAMTLEENMALLQDGLNEKKLANAVRKSGFEEKFQQLPNGMKTQILKNLHTDGIDLSGGEKQKIAIARALYKDGAILILDEPTAALDALAEYKLYKELSDVSDGKTLLFISHRLASTRFCDNIALINNKTVEEYGTHKELMSKNGIYQNMFNVQKQYYEDSDVVEGVSKDA